MENTCICTARDRKEWLDSTSWSHHYWLKCGTRVFSPSGQAWEIPKKIRRSVQTKLFLYLKNLQIHSYWLSEYCKRHVFSWHATHVGLHSNCLSYLIIADAIYHVFANQGNGFPLISASSCRSRPINNSAVPTELQKKAVNTFNNLQHKHIFCF